MRLDYFFYIIAGLNVIMSFFGTNPISSALGWGCAILYCWGFHNKNKFVNCTEGVKDEKE